ncbi:hypothetical protein G6011_09035 [Alternaria panax]|uniref:Peptidase A1 domain-containing protein n=1 Tax=Alternaria panax TaxID=48097 RepID=A0AAD4IAC2_9PLEO|nr:hypothetical protein G6011_09035 [Alternaria panax]
MSNLKRISIIPNPACKRAGMNQYASILQKYDFAPTTEGPFQVVDVATKNLKNLFKPKDKKATTPVLRKVEDDKVGQVKAEDQQNDALYTCPVEIGTPPQIINLHFDTGTGVKSKHNIFDAKASKTFKKMDGASWRIRYGDGSTASGTVGTDNVTLGGLCVEGQAIELASKLSPQFTSGAGDGLLGLAFGHINTVKPKKVATPVEQMILQSDIPSSQELFTCYLGSWRDKNDIDHGESFYTFGYIDEQVLSQCGVSEPHYVPIDPSKGFWQFSSPTATLNGETVQRPAGNTAIADTGTTLALLDDTLCEKIYSAIPGAVYDKAHQGWTFPIATKVSDLPTLALAVGDKVFEVQKEDFGFAKCGADMQYGGIQSRGKSEFDILGDTWLKGVYAVFDQGRKRFGAVQRVEGVQNVAVPK